MRKPNLLLHVQLAEDVPMLGNAAHSIQLGVRASFVHLVQKLCPTTTTTTTISETMSKKIAEYDSMLRQLQ